MKPFRVLSLDWDYFVDASISQRVELFPDGGNENLGAYLQSIVWSTRYAFGRNGVELAKVGVDKKATDVVKELVKRLGQNAFCTVWDSHKWLYDEVMSWSKKGQPIEVVNLDFHHDIYGNRPEEIDCGNWVNALFDGKCRQITAADHYYWVKRQDSDKLSEGKSYMSELPLEELSQMTSEFDLIFICRSSMWSPPHLDNEFIQFYESLETKRTEVNITGSRFTEEFQSIIEKENEAWREVAKKNFPFN